MSPVGIRDNQGKVRRARTPATHLGVCVPPYSQPLLTVFQLKVRILDEETRKNIRDSALNTLRLCMLLLDQ